jgi:hypothetical protein
MLHTTQTSHRARPRGPVVRRSSGPETRVLIEPLHRPCEVVGWGLPCLNVPCRALAANLGEEARRTVHWAGSGLF